MSRRRKKVRVCYLILLFYVYVTQTWLVHFFLMVCLCAAGEWCAAAEHPSYPMLAAQHETQQRSANGRCELCFADSEPAGFCAVAAGDLRCFCVQVLIRQVFLWLCVCVCACVNVNLKLLVLPLARQTSTICGTVRKGCRVCVRV
jgi:hypothetical protein